MKTFYEWCDGKIWKAVEAMIIGLETQSKRDDFKINMGHFLVVSVPSGESKNVCFGCAATCALQQITGINLPPNKMLSWSYSDLNGGSFTTGSEMRSKVLEISDLVIAENALDRFRQCNFHILASYFNKYHVFPGAFYDKVFQMLPMLHSETWQNNLQPYRVLLRYLKWRDI